MVIWRCFAASFTDAFQGIFILQDSEKDYVLCVHGYNMKEFDKQRWIETTLQAALAMGIQGARWGFHRHVARLQSRLTKAKNAFGNPQRNFKSPPDRLKSERL